MSDEKEYTPPKVWSWDKEDGSEWSKTNRPISGATHEKALPVGKHPLQLHSLATPNGVKVTVMLEELLALGHEGAQYDAYTIDISKGDQFGSGFVEINPNSKIPALVDRSQETPLNIFESGSILLYLAEKFNALIPSDARERTDCLSWLFWQMGSAPYLGGGFGHFYEYAPYRIEYCIDRFAMETKRQLDVLDKHLEGKTFICGEDYTIADIAIWPWYGSLALGELYSAGEFLDVESYKNLVRWAKHINERPAVKRGRLVNKVWGEENEQLRERHSADDFAQLKTS